MKVRVVCSSRLLRDLISSSLAGFGYDVTQAADQLSSVTDVDDGDILILRIDETAYPDAQVLGRLVNGHTATRILIISPSRLMSRAQTDLSHIAGAIIPENSQLETVRHAISLISEGFRLALPATTGEDARPGMAAQPGSEVGHAAMPDLSKRETAILSRLQNGRSNKEIANELGISDATVKVHLRSIFRKVGVENRTQAALWASTRWRGTDP